MAIDWHLFRGLQLAMPEDQSPPVRLGEYDEKEWRDIAKRLKPEWTDEQFTEAWAEFIKLKAFKRLN